jgi:hypothetical protein
VGPELPLMSSDVRRWLAELFPDERFEQGPEAPKYPGRMVLVTPSQGGGLSVEFAFDQPSFQIHVIGPQSRDARVNAAAEEAERLIFRIDRAILTTQWPREIAGHWVTHAQRFGSGPSPLPTDSAGRAHFVATYLMEAESGYAR